MIGAIVSCYRLRKPASNWRRMFLQNVQQERGLNALSMLRFETFTEGEAVQILHVGPFSDEGPSIDKLHSYIQENGYKASGKHHEIYLSDITKTAPDKLKPIIRQPVSWLTVQ